VPKRFKVATKLARIEVLNSTPSEMPLSWPTSRRTSVRGVAVSYRYDKSISSSSCAFAPVACHEHGAGECRFLVFIKCPPSTSYHPKCKLFFTTSEAGFSFFFEKISSTYFLSFRRQSVEFHVQTVDKSDCETLSARPFSAYSTLTGCLHLACIGRGARRSLFSDDKRHHV